MTTSFANPANSSVVGVNLAALISREPLGAYASSTNRRALEERVIMQVLAKHPNADVEHYADWDIQIFRVGNLYFCVDPRLLKPRLLIVPGPLAPVRFRPHAAKLTLDLSSLTPKGQRILDWAINAITVTGRDRDQATMEPDEFTSRYGLEPCHAPGSAPAYRFVLSERSERVRRQVMVLFGSNTLKPVLVDSR